MDDDLIKVSEDLFIDSISDVGFWLTSKMGVYEENLGRVQIEMGEVINLIFALQRVLVRQGVQHD
jgi:hypothetical protein